LLNQISFGSVTVRHMFSGAGIFADGLMFGRTIRDIIYNVWR
jgi:TfoX/Sxy family transcriptional regulator of competence genes